MNGENSSWKVVHSEKTTKSENFKDDMKSKRRVAVCDATDEAKESRCHMRVIMKKFWMEKLQYTNDIMLRHKDIDTSNLNLKAVEEKQLYI